MSQYININSELDALKIKALQNEKRDLLESLEKYYKAVILHEDLDAIQTQE